MKKLLLLLAATLVFGTSCTMLGELALKAMTTKEKDLSKMAVIGLYNLNIYGEETGVTMGSGGKDYLTTGSNMVGLQFVKNEGIGVYALDGVVTVNGDTARSVTGGIYVVRYDPEDLSDKRVVVTSTSGQTAEFMLKAPSPIRITKVNGQTAEGAPIDLTRPLTIELDFPASATGKTVTVSLVAKAPMNASGFGIFYTTRLARTITIPPDAFRHKHFNGGSPSGGDLVKYVAGANHLKVDLVEESPVGNLAPFPYFKTIGTATDTHPVTVSGEPAGVAYWKIEAESPAPSGKFGIRGQGVNGYYSRPLGSGLRQAALGSFNINGVIYKKEVNTSTSTNTLAGTITTTTVTREFIFPQLDDQYWNAFMDSFYGDVRSLLQRRYGITMVDVDRVTAHPAYAELFVNQETNTDELIRKNYRNTQRLKPATLGEITGSATTAMVADNMPIARLVDGIGADALISMTLELQVGANDEGKIILNPVLRFAVDGPNQSGSRTITEWFSVQVYGAGVPFSREEFKDLAALNRILQKDALVLGLQTALDAVDAKHVETGATALWNSLR